MKGGRGSVAEEVEEEEETVMWVEQLPGTISAGWCCRSVGGAVVVGEVIA